MKHCRRFAVDIEEPGFIVAKSQRELNHVLDTYTEADYAESCERVLRFYGEQETGRSAEEICRRIHAFYEGVEK